MVYQRIARRLIGFRLESYLEMLMEIAGDNMVLPIPIVWALSLCCLSTDDKCVSPTIRIQDQMLLSFAGESIFSPNLQVTKGCDYFSFFHKQLPVWGSFT